MGKTSLLKALEKKSHSTQETSTDGIDVHAWKIGGVDFCTWDFAGQEMFPLKIFCFSYFILSFHYIL